MWGCSLIPCLSPLQQSLTLAGNALETLSPGGSRTRRHKVHDIFHILWFQCQLMINKCLMHDFWTPRFVSAECGFTLHPRGNWAGAPAAGKICVCNQAPSMHLTWKGIMTVKTINGRELWAWTRRNLPAEEGNGSPESVRMAGNTTLLYSTGKVWAAWTGREMPARFLLRWRHLPCSCA